jgi:hypothetical protein
MDSRTAVSAVITTTSFIRTTHHDTTLPHPRPPRPAVRGPATVRVRAEAPPLDPERVLTALLNLMRFIASLAIVDILRVAARDGAEWHLVVHPLTPAPWIGVLCERVALLVQVDPRELAAFARAGVEVNAPSTLDLLLGQRIAPAAASSPRTLASLARSVPSGGALVVGLAAPDASEAWSLMLPASALAEALDAIDAWGADMSAPVTLSPRAGITGDVELVIDGGGGVPNARLWTLAVEPLAAHEADPEASVRVTLSPAEAPLSPDEWPDAEHPVPEGHVALVGEVG